MVIGFSGTAFLILGGADLNETGVNYYAFFVVVATIMYGINLNIIKYFLKSINSLAITSISLFFVGPLALIVLFGFTDYSARFSGSDGVILATFYIAILGVIGTAIALIIFNHLVKITNPVFASSVTYIIPLVAVVWGLIDGEILQVFHYIGITLILIGVWVANLKKKKITGVLEKL